MTMTQLDRPSPPIARAIAEAHGLPADECWACGLKCRPQRAHVVPFSINRIAVPPDGYALLCPTCHDLAPDVADPDYFWEWIERRSTEIVKAFADAVLATTEAAVRAGGDDAALRRVMRAVSRRTAVHAGHWSHSTRLWTLRKAAEQFARSWWWRISDLDLDSPIVAQQMAFPPFPPEGLPAEQPKLSAAQQKHLMKLHRAGEHSVLELAELFKVARATVYRTIERNQSAEALAARARVVTS